MCNSLRMQLIGDTYWRDKSDMTPLRSTVVTTSGEVPTTGEIVDVSEFTLHSYQCIADPTGATSPNSVSGKFSVEVSQTKDYWTEVAAYNITDKTLTGLAYADTWGFSYARTIINPIGSSKAGSGTFIVMEKHNV